MNEQPNYTPEQQGQQPTHGEHDASGMGSGDMQSSAPHPVSTPEKGKGAAIGAVIIVILLVLGGVYYWMTSTQQSNEEMLFADPSEDSIASPNDEPDEIESDLDSFNENEFDASIDASLEATEGELQ